MSKENNHSKKFIAYVSIYNTIIKYKLVSNYKKYY